MTLFRSVVFVAALAGVIAGALMAAMQAYATVPLILEAETYEGAAGHHHHGETAPHGHDAGTATSGHGTTTGDDEGWAPADGFERFFYTTLASMVTAIGFGLVLVAASELAGGITGWRQGLVWGLAGFGVFTLAPSLGLPPELPGMPAADLAARQIWWIGTAAATAGGLALIVFGRAAVAVLAGVALMVTPHVIGAPQPESHESPVPADLHRNFVVAVTITSLIFWLALGALAGLFRERVIAGSGGTQESLA
jgi:cobalt transporter subunit CbtA